MTERLKGVLIVFVCALALCGCKGSKADDRGLVDSEKNLSSPFLVIDLDGDGVEIIPLEDSNVLFDVDGDGLAERTSWIGPDDGFLFILTRQEDRELSLVERRLISGLINGYDKILLFDVDKNEKYNSNDWIVAPRNSFYLPRSIAYTTYRNNRLDTDQFDKNGICAFDSLEYFKSQRSGNVLCKDGKKLPFKEVRFPFEDKNVFWEGFCDHLVQTGNRFKEEYKTRCVGRGYDPFNDGGQK